MREDFRALFGKEMAGSFSAVSIVKQCIQDAEASWDVRLKAVELALKYGFGAPERLDEEQVIIMAERKLEQRIAEARAALGPVDVTPAGGDAE